MEIFSTKDAGHKSGASILLYGQAGVGKTTALASLPSPLIISAEAGLLPLQGQDIAFIPVATLADVRAVYKHLSKDENAGAFKSLVIDSLSEVCDMAFKDCKDRVGDEVVKLYPELRATVATLIRSFKALPMHFVCTARETIKELRKGKQPAPTVVGNKLADDLPHIYDIVLHYTVDSSNNRVVYTNSSTGSVAKDRYGVLPPVIEDTNGFLGKIVDKLTIGESNVV